MKKIIQNTKVIILGLIVAIGAGYASAAWNSAPVSGPTNDNTPIPINVGLNEQSKLGQLFINTDTVTPYAIGLSVFGKTILNGPVQITTGTPGLNKVLTDIDGTGNVGWRDGGGTNSLIDPSSPFATLASTALLSYGESGVNTVNNPDTNPNNWVKVISNPYLQSGTKYGFILLTSGERLGTRILGPNMGGDSGQSVKSRCYNYASAVHVEGAAGRYNFNNIPNIINNYNQVTYQGTFVYNPIALQAAYTPTPSLGSWLQWPVAYNGANLSYQKITGRTESCSDIGKGAYTIYIYKYDDLKAFMDRMFALTGRVQFKFNDPLSGNSALHNISVWQ